MTISSSNPPGAQPSAQVMPTLDLIDQLAVLEERGATHLLRHRRDKVALATQGSYEGLFDPDLEGLSLNERVMVALYACRLSSAEGLAIHYQSCLKALPRLSGLEGAEQETAQSLVEQGKAAELSKVPNLRLRAMLKFTRTLVLNPVAGDKAALQSLPAAGISTPAVVTLAQLIAFLSYQIRLVAGLAAMQAAQQKRVAG